MTSLGFKRNKSPAEGNFLILVIEDSLALGDVMDNKMFPDGGTEE